MENLKTYLIKDTLLALTTQLTHLVKVVHRQTELFLEEGDYLSNHQFGFRKKRSTMHAITELTDHINKKLNMKEKTVALFIDFKKAFDCVQYSVLLQKLKNMGFSQQTVQWMNDYLTDRKQKTYANGTTSDLNTITQGVPQGSILGPLLYILYANDIEQNILKSKVTFYADDTVIYASHKKPKIAMKKVQKDLNRLQKWCDKNGLFINPKKTKFMIVSNRKFDFKNTKHVLNMNSEELQRVPTYTYLGITLDEHLSYEAHTKSIISKVSGKVLQLRKIRSVISSKAALLIYKNMILPILEYGDIYLSSATMELRKKLQTLQNRALKCALGKDKFYRTNRQHKEARLDKLKVRRHRHILIHMYQISKKYGVHWVES